MINSVAPDDYDPTSSGYKCCGGTEESGVTLICDGCEYHFHGECMNVNKPEDMPDIWFCKSCSNCWPKAKVLYNRLSAVLSAMSGSDEESDDSSTNSGSVKRTEMTKQKAIQFNVKLDNRLRRLWDFTNREKHALQRCYQQFGQLPAEEVKHKLGDVVAAKLPEQLEAYFYSLMSQVEYLVRVEQLKELIRDNKITLPECLWKKFEQSTTHTETPNKTKNPDKEQSDLHSDNSNSVPLSEEVSKLVTDMLKDVLAKRNRIHSKRPFESTSDVPPPITEDTDIFHSSSDSLDAIVADLMVSFFFFPLVSMTVNNNNNNNNVKRNFADANAFIESIKLILADRQAYHLDENDVRSFKQIVDKYASRLLRLWPSPQTHQPPADPAMHTPIRGASNRDDEMFDSMPKRVEPMKKKSKSPSIATSTATSASLQSRRHKFVKSDLDCLTETDYELAFGLKKPVSLFVHNLTAQLATKIWRRIQMWSVLRPLNQMSAEEREEYLSEAYNKIKAAENESNFPSKLPNWWYPPKHDKLLVDMTLKYGLGDVASIMNDPDFCAIVNSEQEP
ncbi:hypothetical protein RFI_09528, partial [Reticulomyxa filosa]